jgi:hypothetical protein
MREPESRNQARPMDYRFRVNVEEDATDLGPNGVSAFHFKKLRSRALSTLTFCCMPFLVNHSA